MRSGQRAELIASEVLAEKGYEIVDRNWRRPSCEIDIVAKKSQNMIFFEVKYRKRPDSGTGLEAITSRKLQRMSRGAELWVEENDWLWDYSLGAVSVMGDFDNPQIDIVLDIDTSQLL